jgi:hypothetical protein
MERPLDTQEAQSHEQSMLAQFQEQHAAQHPQAEEPRQQVAESDDNPQASAGCC